MKSETKEKIFKLVKLLGAIKKDRDFVEGVIANCRNDKGYDMMIDFLEKEENLTTSDTLAYSLLMWNGERDDGLDVVGV